MANKIKATFVGQHWEGPNEDEAVEKFRDHFDATGAVLSLTLDEIKGLEDCRDSTDRLSEGLVSWKGPFEVLVVDEILVFFGVHSLADITQEMLDTERAQHATAALQAPPSWGWLIQHEFDFEPTEIVHSEDEGQCITLSQDIPVQRRLDVAKRIVEMLNADEETSGVDASAREAAGEKRWQEVCNGQNWNEESQVIHFEGFLRSKGLLAEFASYAASVAAEENAETAVCG